MLELEVVDMEVEPLDRVEFNPDGRVDYEDGRLRCLYPSEADTTEFVIAVFKYSNSYSVKLPSDSVVLNVDEGSVMTAVPSSAYGVGGGA